MEINESVIRNRVAKEIYNQFMPICRCEQCGTLETGNLVERIIDLIQDQA